MKVNINVFLLLLLCLVGCSQTKEPKQSIQLNVHLNQVAMEAKGPKSAVIAFSDAIKPTQLKVEVIAVNVPDKVLHLAQIQEQGRFDEWSNANQAEHYYVADFSEFTQAGQYQLRVSYQGQSMLTESFDLAKDALFDQTIASLLSYFNYSRNDQRYSWEEDKHIRIFDTDRYVDVRGGWNDAGGDTGKYLSHLSYSNFLNPQQLSLVAWALAYSYQEIPEKYQALGLDNNIIEEVFWGADYLHRILDAEGYFYMTVFDQWNTNNAERVVTAYEGPDGIYTEKYQAAFRQGAGTAIAALARAATLAKQTQLQGEFSGQEYLNDAERAFAHLLVHNSSYCDDGKENIIDDYTALLAALELYRATDKTQYLEHARYRVKNLAARMTDSGWFISNQLTDDNQRPYYHAAEAGFPVYALSLYAQLEPKESLKQQALSTVKKSLAFQLALNNKVVNPFNYARQPFKIYKDGVLDSTYQEGFFIPHANETGYWWQGESARLSSLTAAGVLAGRMVFAEDAGYLGLSSQLAHFVQNQLDWTLGRNPYDLTMLNGFGSKNPPAYHGLDMVPGGISNGITGAKGEDAGRGIEFGPEPDWQNWRWVEQWLPHSTWFLLANTEMVKALD